MSRLRTRHAMVRTFVRKEVKLYIQKFAQDPSDIMFSDHKDLEQSTFVAYVNPFRVSLDKFTIGKQVSCIERIIGFRVQEDVEHEKCAEIQTSEHIVYVVMTTPEHALRDIASMKQLDSQINNELFLNSHIPLPKEFDVDSLDLYPDYINSI